MSKVLDHTDEVITMVPGYVWTLKGFMEVYGDNELLMIPYKGHSLYVFEANIAEYQKWPFRWDWMDMKGHIGLPTHSYSEADIRRFIDETETKADLVQLHKEITGENAGHEEIAKNIVKSIKPGLVIPFDNTYTDNFEMIVNIPVKMRRIATRASDDRRGFSDPESSFSIPLIKSKLAGA